MLPEKGTIIDISTYIYLMYYFQVHISCSSTVPDHCRTHALSDPKDTDFHGVCDHAHDGLCDRCDHLALTLNKIDKALDSVTGTPEETDELLFNIKHAKQNIDAWKAHLLRSLNQDDARLDILEDLDKNSVLLVQDWAMKYLPRKYRESQRDWFAKRGLPWHITVAFRRGQADEIEMATFVHVFQTCTQDSITVLCIMKDVLRQLKDIMPDLKSVFYRQDNAGCYHSALTITTARNIAEAAGIKIMRMDFSEPQGGKGACDRKAAAIKSHMRLYLNSGKDIETAAQMKEAIESSGGLPSVSVTLCGTPNNTPSTKRTLKWEGVSLVSNIEYCEEGLRIWRAYNVGPGKLLPWSKFANSSQLPSITIIENSSSQVQFALPKSRKSSNKVSPDHQNSTDESDEVQSDDSEEDDHEVVAGYPISSKNATSKLFCCPEDGCVKSYQRYSSLQHHLECGRHRRELERETLLDKAMCSYANRLEVGGARMQAATNSSYQQGLDVHPSSNKLPAPMGWSLKTSSTKRVKFTTTQRDYLRKKFLIGKTTGRKLDPSIVAKDMRSTKDVLGDRLFAVDEFLTSQQIVSYFSRLASSGTFENIEEEEKEESEDVGNSAKEEKAIEDMKSLVAKEVDLSHPIIYDTHNICELVATDKLSVTFSVTALREICLYFDIDVTDVTAKRKKPYTEKLHRLVGSCTCHLTKAC